MFFFQIILYAHLLNKDKYCEGIFGSIRKITLFCSLFRYPYTIITWLHINQSHFFQIMINSYLLFARMSTFFTFYRSQLTTHLSLTPLQYANSVHTKVTYYKYHYHKKEKKSIWWHKLWFQQRVTIEFKENKKLLNFTHIVIVRVCDL